VRRSFYGPALARIHRDGHEGHARAAAPRVLAALRAAGVRRGLVLDLGCGAGVLSEVLVRRGHEVVGVDVSPAMLATARRRVPRARFVRGSIDRVALPPCDAAVAIGEVLNYLPTEAALARTLRRVRAALRPGGVLVLDALLPRPRRRRVAARAAPSWALIATIDESPTRVRRDIVWFAKDGRRWLRGREVHVQRLLSVSALSRLLRAAGLSVRSSRLDASHALLVARRT
jgi:SAM-dependent methyltransferase